MARTVRVAWALASGSVAAVLLGSGCRLERHEPPPDSRTMARQEVVAELRQYYADLSARDWPRFAGHFWENAIIATAWQPPGETRVRVDVKSVPAFIEQAPLGPESREIFEETMRSAEVQVYGNLAHAWVRYRARFGDPPEVEEWEGVDAFSLLRVSGRWRIVSLVFAPE